MRTLKPWTAVAQALDPVLESLHAATPVRPDGSLSDWLSHVTFAELILVDSLCYNIRSGDLGHAGSPCGDLRAAQEDPAAERRRERLAIQFGLRLQFGRDVCRRYIGLRCKVHWTGDVEKDTKHILCDCWYGNALYWAFRVEH